MTFPLVTTSWLAANLNASQLILIDVSMSKVVGKTAIEYDEPVFIPGSYQLDLENTLSDLNSAQTHAFPSAEQFTAVAQKLGIHSESIVVFYDNQGVYSAPRAWWIFQAMGFKQAFVLDGGLPQWLLENRPVLPHTRTQDRKQGDVQGKLQSQLVCDARYIMQKLPKNQITVLDARSKERFLGTAAEPRAGVRSGHIPKSLNLPFQQVLHEHCLKSPEKLSVIFAGLLETKSQQLVFSCGSGITACIILLSAVVAGYQDVILYDGSWAEWGRDDRLPIEPLLPERQL